MQRWRGRRIHIFRDLGRWNPRASSSAMLVAIWLTVPSSAVMRARSSVAAEVNETGGRSAPEDIGGGSYVGRAPEYVGSTPAGVRGGEACVSDG
ncbi:hypothetical protein CDL15_Pgr012345 [Punica granatum]|uniref:Uncharacterized protein n=1 Tax=Punica granatum TaxID=22663 RepID=A0A218X5K5_PUNGR|nr:hypothetical protein CDL15_Pgr012345 [Punica granatum]